MHMTFCSSKEQPPSLFLDTAVKFEADEQLQRSLKCPCHEALLGNIFPLRFSPQLHFFSFYFSFHFSLFHSQLRFFMQEVLLLSTGSSLYTEMFSLNLYGLFSPPERPRAFLSQKMFLLGSERLSSLTMNASICAELANDKACLERNLAHRLFIMHKCIIGVTRKAVRTSALRVRSGVCSSVFLQCYCTERHIPSHLCYWKGKSGSVSTSFLVCKCQAQGSLLSVVQPHGQAATFVSGLLPSVLHHSFKLYCSSPRPRRELPPTWAWLSPLYHRCPRVPSAPKLSHLHQNSCTSELDGNSVLGGILEPFQPGKQRKINTT